MTSALSRRRTALSPSGFYGWHVVAYSAIALPWIGRGLDRFGVRRTMAVVGAVFGAVGISSTPLLLEPLLADLGWGNVWRIEGFVIWLIVIPLGLLAMRDRPADLGQHPDGPVVVTQRPATPHRAVGVSRAEALRHPYFWLICAAVALTGLLTTAVAFHQISLLTERGLSPAQAAANFVPQTVAGLTATLAAGYLMHRFAGRWMIVASTAVLSAGLWWGTTVSPGVSAFVFGAMLGAAASMIRAVETVALPRYFGTLNLGSIRGLVASISVAGTACGPVLFAAAFERTGSHSPALLTCAVAPLIIIVWALIAKEPALGRIDRRTRSSPDLADSDPATTSTSVRSTAVHTTNPSS